MTYDVYMSWFIYLGFYVAFNTVQVISRQVVGRAEETSTCSSSGFCTVNCRPTASNYQLPTLGRAGNRTPASEVGGESVPTLPPWPLVFVLDSYCLLFIFIQEVNVFRGHDSEVHLLLPFGGHLVSVDKKSHVRVWDIHSAGKRRCIEPV